MTKRKLRFFVEYACWPIWENIPGWVDNINPERLPISFELKRDIVMWTRAFENTFNTHYPPDSKFENTQEAEDFKVTGRHLVERLREELGDDVFEIESPEFS